jgi:predicted transposase/invertase (TIGR01784 family)
MSWRGFIHYNCFGFTSGLEFTLVKTDTIYYQLFKRFPSLVFTLINHSPQQAKNYRFESIEVKETAFRIDGVFLPPEKVSPRVIYFAEVQFQSDEFLYFRFFAEIMMYLNRNRDRFDDWFGVVIFPSRSLEPENPAMHRSILNSTQVQRIYLDELGDSPDQPVGIRLMQLTIAEQAQTPEQARLLIQEVNQKGAGDFSNQEILDMICTIAVYKFSKLSRFEVEAMLGLRLEETRVYQEANADGKLEGERSLVLRLLSRRVGNISADLQAQIQSLSLPQVEALGEALLDFSALSDLTHWLENNQG